MPINWFLLLSLSFVLDELLNYLKAILGTLIQ